MVYNGFASATGRVNNAAIDYDTDTNTLTYEFFVSYHSLGLENKPESVDFRFGSPSNPNDFWMNGDNNKTLTSSGLPIL